LTAVRAEATTVKITSKGAPFYTAYGDASAPHVSRVTSLYKFIADGGWPGRLWALAVARRMITFDCRMLRQACPRVSITSVALGRFQLRRFLPFADVRFQTADGLEPLFISAADGSPENVECTLAHLDTMKIKGEDTLRDALSVKKFLTIWLRPVLPAVAHSGR
jgi:hypothetical protein